MTWLPGWSKRVKLTIDQNDIDAALTDFPILVYISASSGRNNDDVSCVFDELTEDANRKKIAVTKADGITQCYVEIEKWDDANEKAWLHVSRDGWEIASDVDTDLYLYYDKDHADNTDYVGDTNSTPAENVWDEHFKAVYHMRDGVDNAHIYDSTNNNYDGVKKGANEPNEVAGQVGRAQQFDKVDDDIDIPITDKSFTALTFFMLFKPMVGAVGQTSRPVYWGYSADPYGIRITLVEAGIGGYLYVRNTGGTVAYSAYSCSVDTWVMIGITWDGAQWYEVKDGVRTLIGDFAGTVAPTANLQLGYETVQTFGGALDEIRISDTDRSSAWTKATKESLWDDLLAFGSEEETTAGAFYLKSNPFGINLISAGGR